jgi:hypothetical protein
MEIISAAIPPNFVLSGLDGTLVVSMELRRDAKANWPAGRYTKEL